MATKKKAKLSVAHELYHLVEEVHSLNKNIECLRSNMNANYNSTTRIEKELVHKGVINPQPLPDFDLKTTMERDGGKCLYDYKGRKLGARVVCTDYRGKNGKSIAFLHEDPVDNFKECGNSATINGKGDIVVGESIHRQILFTLPPPK